MADNRRALRESYRQRPVTGGVFQIINEQNGKRLICAERDLDGSRNRFNFSVMTGSCVHNKLSADWSGFGPQAFRFEVLEQIEKAPEQSDREFADDLEVLRELWLEKVEPALRY